MNSIVQQQFGVLKQTMVLRDQLMDVLTAQDLAYKLPGNMTLGELCREMGEVEQSYIDSFKTFRQDWSYRYPEPGIASDLGKLKVWFQSLDAALLNVLEALSEDDIQHKTIDRGFQPSLTTQLHIYREGLLIFYGKASIYIKALEKPLPGDWPNWIA
ncbi:MAG: hypothetical protein K8J31_17075 [Anaerolineae bacterium]|nr:hypothetical protein [Anaerolineae bacterium]